MFEKHLLLFLLAPLFLVAGIHPSPWPWLSLVAFLPLFLLVFDNSLKRLRLIIALSAGSLFYYGTLFSGLLYFDVRIYGLTVAVCLLFLPGYFLILRFLTAQRSDRVKISCAALLWILFYKIYASSPAGPAAVESPFYTSLPFFQTASLTGFSLFPALVLGLTASVALSILHRRSKSALSGIAIFALAIAIHFVWGNSELKRSTPAPLHWAVIQHNLPISGEWRLKHQEEILTRYRELALAAAKENPGMIIFPLYSLPDGILKDPVLFADLAKETKAWILAATHIPVSAEGPVSRGFFNTALLFSPEGKPAGRYQAVQSPPFRRLPEQNQKEYKILPSPFGELGILLCYEDCLPVIARKAAEDGAEILIALSNPGHFTATNMPYYHFLQDRLRALETERFVVRASANGYSGVIDPKGLVIRRSTLNREEILQIPVGRSSSQNRFRPLSDGISLAALLFCAGLLLQRFRRDGKKAGSLRQEYGRKRKTGSIGLP